MLRGEWWNWTATTRESLEQASRTRIRKKIPPKRVGCRDEHGSHMHENRASGLRQKASRQRRGSVAASSELEHHLCPPLSIIFAHRCRASIDLEVLLRHRTISQAS